MVRINAHGVFLDSAGKVISTRAEKTAKGYALQVVLKMDKEEIGFDIWAHDFTAQGEYRSTRYWNALAFSHAGSSSSFGVVKIKE